MRIGIDIDDTTVVLVKPMIKYADLYDTQVLGRSGTNGQLGLIQNRYYLKALYGWDDKTKFEFLDRYYKNVLEECELMPNAVEVMNKFKEEGHEIYFITARLLCIKDCDTESITKETLKDIHYNKLIMNASDKMSACREHDIDIFIEDSYDTCKELQENGIKSYLMTTVMNQNINAGNIERVKDWDEIYLKVKDYIDSLKG